MNLYAELIVVSLLSALVICGLVFALIVASDQDVRRALKRGFRKRILFWRYGVRVWCFGLTVGLLGPKDPPLFSERQGIRRPILRVGPWRVFVDRSGRFVWPYWRRAAHDGESGGR